MLGPHCLRWPPLCLWSTFPPWINLSPTIACSWILSRMKPRTPPWWLPQRLRHDLGYEHLLAPHSLSCSIVIDRWWSNALKVVSKITFNLEYLDQPNHYMLLLFSCLVMSNSLQPRGLQHARLPCPSPSPGACSNSCHLSRRCHATILSSVVPFSSCPESFPASGSFLMSQLFASGGQRTGASASASVLPMNSQDWLPSGWTDWISLQSKGLSRVFSNTTVQKHQFFDTQPSLWSSSHIHIWLLEWKPQSQKTKLITWISAVSNSVELYCAGPPKTDGSRWGVLRKHGPRERGRANHFSILAWRTPWTVLTISECKIKDVHTWKDSESLPPAPTHTHTLPQVLSFNKTREYSPNEKAKADSGSTTQRNRRKP